MTDPGRRLPSATRRTTLAGAAWTAPVVVLATAAPALATSLPLTAQPDSFLVGRDSGATTFDVLANDTIPAGVTAVITSVTDPAHGTVTIDPGGQSLSYTPDAGYANNDPYSSGDPDTFEYTVNGLSTAAVAVTVTTDSRFATQYPVTAGDLVLTRPNGSTNTDWSLRVTVNNRPATGTPGHYVFTANWPDPNAWDRRPLSTHWFLSTSGYPVYTAAGITGYRTTDLVVLANSLLNSTYTLRVEATSVNGRMISQSVGLNVTNSSLDASTYDTCQALPAGDPGCSNPNAGPATDT